MWFSLFQHFKHMSKVLKLSHKIVLLTIIGGIVSMNSTTTVVSTTSISSNQIKPVTLIDSNGALSFSIILNPNSPTVGNFSFTDAYLGTYVSTSHNFLIKYSPELCGNNKSHDMDQLFSQPKACKQTNAHQPNSAFFVGIAKTKSTGTTLQDSAENYSFFMYGNVNIRNNTGYVSLYLLNNYFSDWKNCFRLKGDNYGQVKVQNNNKNDINCNILDTFTINDQPPPIKHLIPTAKTVLKAITVAVGTSNLQALYQYLSPSLKALYQNPLTFENAFSPSNGTKITKTAIVGRPVTKDLNGINYAILKVNVTMQSENNITTTTTWGLEFVYQGGAWWFFGTAPL